VVHALRNPSTNWCFVYPLFASQGHSSGLLYRVGLPCALRPIHPLISHDTALPPLPLTLSYPEYPSTTPHRLRLLCCIVIVILPPGDPGRCPRSSSYTSRSHGIHPRPKAACPSNRLSASTWHPTRPDLAGRIHGWTRSSSPGCPSERASVVLISISPRADALRV